MEVFYWFLLVSYGSDHFKKFKGSPVIFNGFNPKKQVLLNLKSVVPNFVYFSTTKSVNLLLWLANQHFINMYIEFYKALLLGTLFFLHHFIVFFFSGAQPLFN